MSRWVDGDIGHKLQDAEQMLPFEVVNKLTKILLS